MSIKSFFKTVFTHHLYDIEKLILDSVRSKLRDDIALIWDKQLKAINKIQRLPDGVEVNFYMMRKGRSSFDIELLFPNKTTELLLAKVQIELLGKKLNASVWCVRGQLFSIEYKGSINYFEDNYGIVPEPDLVIKSEILADLSENIEDETKQPENGIYRNERYFFRFIGLNERLREKLKNTINGIDISDTRSKKNIWVTVLTLKENYNYEDLYRFIDDNSISPSDYGIRVSLVTEIDSSGVDVPPYIVEIIQKTGGGIAFTFTVV